MLPGTGIESELARKIVRLFIEQTTNLLATITSASAAGDAQSVRGAAHMLKSSAASVGAAAVSVAAVELEAVAREGEAQSIAAHCAHLRREYERFCHDPAIETLLAVAPAGKPAA